MLPDLRKLLEPRPRKYRNLARHLTRYLNIPDDSELLQSETDLFDDLSSSRGSSRFLGVFSTRGITFGLKQFGILDHLQHAGLPNGQVRLDTRDPYRHRIQIIHEMGSREILSAELVMRRGQLSLPLLAPLHQPAHDFLIVEWFLLQHPLKRFTKKRPQLPGQDYPGLGISRLIFELLYWTGRRLQVSGVVLIPNYLHTGLFYGRQCLFLDPEKQGQLYALAGLLSRDVKLDQLSWACAEGHLIRRKSDESLPWKPAPMVLPVSQALKDYFHAPEYIVQMSRAKKEYRVQVRPGYKKSYTADWTAQ
ncbi:MAG: hypothetical protein GXO90_10770 [FCB group bacterium]|nr:hypothetical protein [FCB group bacterium]